MDLPHTTVWGDPALYRLRGDRPTQKLTKYAIFALTVLIASLLSDYLVDLISSEFVDHSYKGVAIEMCIIIIVYYPAFTIIEKLVLQASKKYVISSKKAVKSSSFGLLIGFVIAVLVLFYLFAKMKHSCRYIICISSVPPIYFSSATRASSISK